MAKGARRVESGVDVKKEELLNVIKLGAELAEVRESSPNRPVMLLPMSGNDKKPFQELLKCLNVTAFTLSEVLRKYGDTRDECEVSALSFMKPELYEYSRVPGYKGSRKEKIKVNANYAVVSMAGWVLSRLGKARIGRDSVGVHLFPLDVDSRYGVLPEFLKDVEKIPGIAPVTAFTLWLASKLVRRGVAVEQLMMYAVHDAGGMSPASIAGGWLIGLDRVLKNRSVLSEAGDLLEEVVLDAMSLESKTRAFSIRVSNALYDVLNGSGSLEEFLYFSNRGALEAWRTNDKRLLEKYVRMAQLGWIVYRHLVL
ncbi:hypothetical protein HS1genome_1961 [Sulfodiicoccus acidiphilus]|uniref:Uncharacterized protein n=1 Tax=Sulfodiicoccus acidiphilus TaxID=1670455 RepID=A0A348B5X0_9CREN|nr:type I-A CRISPR-associated protein CsaX [Sulfodiicoccus acidiphilus]BBD73572.1 hypothetical protein HS1genome_1961 [Sulfodiicoccus acidiphilus]GGU01774.1 hypothetical protein GCM10007116_18700 [Sulfodiicoccus acidiphilus]